MSLNLRLLANGREMPIDVAIGAPYAPARTEGQEKMSGCLLSTSDDEALAIEILGKDNLEALEMAVRHIRLFLCELVSRGGELRYLDGSKFEPEGSQILKQFKEHAAKIRKSGG